VPGYVAAAKDLKELGIDEVIIYCVNDGAVMDAWAEDRAQHTHMQISLARHHNRHVP